MSKFADITIDAAIVKRAARGDTKAHEILYRAYSAPVYSVALRFTRIPAQAEDLTQETFIEVIRSIGRFRGEAPVGMWIRRIAISKALMFLRSAWTARGQSLAEDWNVERPTGRRLGWRLDAVVVIGCICLFVDARRGASRIALGHS